jgi:O-antigen ligase
VLLALVLSYRRSFWIADVLGIALVVLLGLNATGRRLLIPAALLVAGALWLLGGAALQSDTPLGARVQSLQASRIEAKPEDRYRLDERANVLAEIKDHPVTGLGLGVPWRATARPLPVEPDADHAYVHFAALYWWLKLGVLGLIAYATLLCAGAVAAVRVWRRRAHRWVRAFGLASLCGIVGLAVIETTATFTGVDPRFTVLLGAQLGLLAALSRPAAPSPPR